jgi:putative ubiquitin-RnfH superfamily antitoxin RatB of RatAB toxin-antitoxin module
MVEVKVTMVPGAIKNVMLNDGATVADALAAADLSATDGYTIQVDGQTATTSTAVQDGSRVILARSAKGNA